VHHSRFSMAILFGRSVPLKSRLVGGVKGHNIK